MTSTIVIYEKISDPTPANRLWQHRDFNNYDPTKKMFNAYRGVGGGKVSVQVPTDQYTIGPTYRFNTAVYFANEQIFFSFDEAVTAAQDAPGGHGGWVHRYINDAWRAIATVRANGEAKPMRSTMFYYLSRTADEYPADHTMVFSCVVEAESEFDARQAVVDRTDDPDWFDSDFATCIELHSTGDTRILIED